MRTGFYQRMVNPGAHSSSPFQPAILTEWLNQITTKTPITESLDLCSGLGLNLPTLSRFSSKVLASDISEPALKVSQNNHSNFKNIRYLCCDAQKLKAASGRFDLVVCTEALEHVQNPEKVIRECNRVLKRHGFLIISTPNYWNLTGLIKWFYDKKAGRQYWDPWGAHKLGLERMTNPSYLHTLLFPHFKASRSRGANFLLAWFYFLSPLRKYYDHHPFLFLGRTPIIRKFGMQYYILAQKK